MKFGLFRVKATQISSTKQPNILQNSLRFCKVPKVRHATEASVIAEEQKLSPKILGRRFCRRLARKLRQKRPLF